MKKIQKILGITLSLITILLLSGCAITHSVFSAGYIKSVYESAGFEITLIYDKNLIEDDAELFKTYQGITFSEMPDIDTVYLVEHTVKELDKEGNSVSVKDGNSALVVVFGVPGEVISFEDIKLLAGSGCIPKSSYNVYVCRFKVGDFDMTESKWNLDSPEIIALYSPLIGANPDKTESWFY